MIWELVDLHGTYDKASQLPMRMMSRLKDLHRTRSSPESSWDDFTTSTGFFFGLSDGSFTGIDTTEGEL